MKTATLLFGLAACTHEPIAKSQYPLCDRQGAPACGNIGQVGRAAPTPAPPVAPASSAVETRPILASERAPLVTITPPPVTPPTAQRPRAQRPRAPRPAVTAPAQTRVLVGASQTQTMPNVAAYPLKDHRENVVCGNVMGKGGSRRVCRDASTNAVVSSTSKDTDGGDL